MIEIEKKYMSKESWTRILERKYVFENFKKDNIDGQISLLYMKKVREPLYKKYDNTNIKIVDNEYYWLQIGINNKNCWITAMYDDKMKLIQYYIDITKCNIIKEDGNSYYYDMFLDIVLLSNGSYYVLDNDELDLALKEDIINSDEKRIVIETSQKIIKYLQNNKSILNKFTDKYLKQLKSKI